MQQNHSKGKNHFFIKLFTCLIVAISFSQVYGQTLSISGTVTASNVAVRNALVTFIDVSDTTKQYTATTDSLGKYRIDNITAIESEKINLPTTFKLEQNYPNPFVSSTEIPYKLKTQTSVRVTIYDILGREVRKFSYSSQGPGSHSILWNGRNNFGEKVAAGIYFYRLEVAGKSLVKKMVFGTGQSNISFSVPLLSSQMPSSGAGKILKVSGGTFNIKIANTDSTFPIIISETFDNQDVQNNAAVDFSVSSLYPIVNSNINLDSTQQLIRGFGASNILLWRPDMTNSEIQTAFGTGTGQLGFTILRLMIEADSTRWSQYVPTAKKAYEMGATIIASPWYAPSDMVETVNGVSRVRHDMYGKYAAHLNSFISYMASNGVPIYGVSVQNEPDITGNWTSWTSDEMFTFMKDYADSIVGAKVMDPESFHFDRTYSDPILNDSAACANTDIICGHIYGSGLATYSLAQAKGKEIWMTEYLINSDMNGSKMDTSWAAALATANSINNCMNANMSAYVWWYIVRFYGPIADGTYVNKGSVTRKGYVMSQFARFIRPGFYRVQASSYSPRNIYDSAYKDSTSKVVIVAINNSQFPVYQTFSVSGGIITSVTPFTTSASKNCEQENVITVTNGSFTAELEPSSITTFVSN